MEIELQEYNNRPDLPGYVSIKQAAKILGLSIDRVYTFVDEQRLKSMWAGNTIMIPIGEVQQFQRQRAGRPRKSDPNWHISSGENMQYTLTVTVQLCDKKRVALLKHMEHIRESSAHMFPGTVARYIIESTTTPCQIEIILIWRKVYMPNEVEREKALDAFRKELASILDWSTAHYSTGEVLMHT